MENVNPSRKLIEVLADGLTTLIENFIGGLPCGETLVSVTATNRIDPETKVGRIEIVDSLCIVARTVDAARRERSYQFGGGEWRFIGSSRPDNLANPASTRPVFTVGLSPPRKDGSSPHID